MFTKLIYIPIFTKVALPKLNVLCASCKPTERVGV